MSGADEIDRQAILEGIRELADGDSPPTLSKFDEYGPASKKTVYRRFESWDDALKQAGYEQSTVGPENIVETIDELADGDIPPSLSKFVEHSSINRHTIYDCFNSWSEAVRQAGYEPNRRTEVDREEILETIRDLADGETAPTSDDYKEGGPTSLPMVYDYFDSWSDAVAAAGFEPPLRRGLPREKVLDSVREVAEDIGRHPKWRNLTSKGLPAPTSRRTAVRGRGNP